MDQVCLEIGRWKWTFDMPLYRRLRGTERILVLVMRRTEPALGQEKVMNSLCRRDPHLREIGGFPRVS